ncbi:hypothetical protein TNIN_421061, partial [Trichonephila inaurata madagascariensis]
MNSLV